MRRPLPVAEPSITAREVELVTQAVSSGWISSLGEFLPRFEQGFAGFVGVRHALTTSSGTTALHLALLSLGIGPGDEVVVPDLTFVATANAVVYTGALPVPVDVEPSTWCLDPQAFRRALTPATRAVIPVHLYGHPADMDPILAIARERGIAVIEDGAEAHGAEYKGRRVGGLGTCSAFSFYGNKIITTGEGGMILTDDEALARRAAFLRDQAMDPDRRYWHPEVGFNFRMTNLQAALGVAQLERIGELLAAKERVFGWYRANLDGAPGLALNPGVDWAKSVHWMVCLVVDDAARRDPLMERLRARGIDTRPFFHPLSTLPMYDRGPRNPVARSLAARGLNLPSGPSLTRDEVDFVCRAVLEESRNAGGGTG